MLSIAIRLNYTLIGHLEILRDASDTDPNIGNYSVTKIEYTDEGKGSFIVGPTVRVENFDRNRKAFALLSDALKALGY